MRRSANTRPPFFGPQFPDYPPLRQIVRVVSQAGSVYNGFIQQWDNRSNTFRDREACYVWEPNGVVVKPGYCKGRLVGNYNGLPLIAASLICCVGASSFVSSSKKSSSLTSLRSSLTSIRPSPSVSPVTSPSIQPSVTPSPSSSSGSLPSSSPVPLIPSNCCAKGIPEVIHATFFSTGTGTCCQDGAQVTLTYVGLHDQWEGTTIIADCATVDFVLKCTAVDPTGTVNDLQLQWQFPSFAFCPPQNTNPDPTYPNSCDPIDIQYLLVSDGAADVCGCTGSPVNLYVHITL